MDNGKSGLGIATGIVGIASLVLSLVGCCCSPIAILSIILGIAAVVLGIIEKKNSGAITGFPLVGFIMGIVALIPSAISIVIWIISLITGAGTNMLYYLQQYM